MSKSFTYKIIKEYNLIIEIFVGEIYIKNRIQNKNDINKDKDFGKSQSIIIDFRKADFQMKHTHVGQLHDYLNKNEIL